MFGRQVVVLFLQSPPSNCVVSRKLVYNRQLLLWIQVISRDNEHSHSKQNAVVQCFNHEGSSSGTKTVLMQLIMKCSSFVVLADICALLTKNR